uniref:Uncharacterized protein n=1 Tax=Anguilla anguilla TaxID=7936 RepID=A0A0E9S9S6_ANGAN
MSVIPISDRMSFN